MEVCGVTGLWAGEGVGRGGSVALLVVYHVLGEDEDEGELDKGWM